MPEVLKESNKKVPYTEQIKKAKKMVKKKEVNSYLIGDHGDYCNINGRRMASDDSRVS